MKYLIASDVHGSLFYAQKLIERLDAERADRLILLGDLYYHGPRNPLPKDYNPAEVAKLFNLIQDRLTVVRGNCDSEVDQMISTFKILPSFILKTQGKTVYFTHGHRINQAHPPKREVSALIYGHEHVGFIRKEGGTVFANCGSVSLPKNEVRSFLVLDGSTLTLKTLEGEGITSVTI